MRARLTALRTSWRRPAGTTLVAAALPVLVLLGASLVDGGERPEVERVAPEETPLTRATLICPPGGPDVSIASLSSTAGEVDVEVGDDRGDVTLEPRRPTTLDLGRRAVVVTGRDALAPGLVANRYTRPWASTDCRPPVVDQWFTGVGAGAKHRSTLQLVNPDAGRAVVDVVVLGRGGEVSVPALRGLAIAGGETRRFDLAEVVPRRDDLALHVTTLRGRVSASVADTFTEIGRGEGASDGLAAQDAPSTSNLVLGLTSGQGQRTLVLANPTDDEGRATVRLVTADSVFVPDGAEDVVLPPRSAVRVGLAPLLRGTGSDDASRPYGVQVDSTVEATAGLVMFVEGDLAQGVPTPQLDGPATVALPAADKELVLGGATAQGVVTLSLWDGAGRSLPDQRVEVGSDRGFVVDLPREARLMTLTPDRTAVAASVLITGDGTTLVGLREPLLTGLEPFVRPGLP
jgi:hypothetical protein